ncbi:MAG: RDD family protein [Methylophilaceae bacterium]|nr:RDD family protein [Methylophilaceae bacterium]
MIYDSLLLLAILFAATFVFLTLFGNATAAPLRYFLQIYLWLIAAVYFIWCWLHGGQTLAMRTWHIQLSHRAGTQISSRQAIWRYLLASLGLGFFGAGFFWALFDRDNLFLHDRLTGCQLTKQ